MKQCMDFENLHRRLKKIIGQVQAIDRMVDEDIPYIKIDFYDVPWAFEKVEKINP